VIFITFFKKKVFYNLPIENVKEGENMTEKKDRNEEEKQHHDADDHHKLDLRGTFMMVMTIGGLMVLSWFAVFILFMERM